MQRCCALGRGGAEDPTRTVRYSTSTIWVPIRVLVPILVLGTFCTYLISCHSYGTWSDFPSREPKARRPCWPAEAACALGWPSSKAIRRNLQLHLHSDTFRGPRVGLQLSVPQISVEGSPDFSRRHLESEGCLRAADLADPQLGA